MEVLMLTDHPDTSCCCICIFTAVLSPSDLFTSVRDGDDRDSRRTCSPKALSLLAVL